MNESLYWLIGYWEELIKMYYMIGFVFRCKCRTWMSPVIAVLSIVIVILPQCNVENSIMSTVITVAVLLTVLVVLEKKRELLLAIASVIVINFLDLLLSGILLSILRIETEEFRTYYLISTILNLLSVIPIYLMARLVEKVVGKKRVSYSKNALKQIGMITLGLWSAILFFVPLELMPLDITDRKIQVSLIAMIVSLFLFVGIAVSSIIMITRKEQSERENEIKGRLLKEQQQYYRDLLAREEETKCFRHDVFHHMNCIKEFLHENRVEQAIQYMDSIYGMMESKSVISTGNTCLDIVINHVWKDCQEMVNLNWEGMFPAQMNLMDIDSCILFSDLFKNALEATLESGKEKEITAVTKVSGNNVVFTLTNPYMKVKRGGRNGLRSTKSAHRGYGMQNIREVVEKYGGKLEIHIEELFTIEIILPNMIAKV